MLLGRVVPGNPKGRTRPALSSRQVLSLLPIATLILLGITSELSLQRGTDGSLKPRLSPPNNAIGAWVPGGQMELLRDPGFLPPVEASVPGKWCLLNAGHPNCTPRGQECHHIWHPTGRKESRAGS